MNVRRSILVLAALLLPALACQLLVGIDHHDFRTPDAQAVDAAPAVDVVQAAPELCAYGVVPPTRPSITDEPDQPTLVFAMSRASLRGRDADGGVVGFDVDGVCTCDPRDHSTRGNGGSSCKPSASPVVPGGCDDDGGVDNAVAHSFDIFANVPGFSGVDDSLNAQIRCGHQTLLYVLQNYNGQANDPDVVVTAIESSGINEPHDGGVEVDASVCNYPASGPYPAKFDGTDVWSPAETASQLFSGWVRDFHLVLDGRAASAGGIKVLPILFGARVITIGTPILVAHLVPLDQGGAVLGVDGAGKILSPSGKAASFRLEEGLLSGRASAGDVLTAAGVLRIGGGGAAPGSGYLCAQQEVYCFLRNSVCHGVDTMKLASLDFQGSSCDALSMVLQFDAVASQMSPTPFVTQGLPDGGCAATWTDTCDPGVSEAGCP